MVVISIKEPSPRVMSKLRNGHKVRIMAGEGVSLALSPEKANDIMKKLRKPNKGMHIQLSPEEIVMNRSVDGKGIFSTLKSIGKVVAPIAQDVAISVAKDTAKSALKNAISGTGRPRGRKGRSEIGEGFLDALKSVGKVVAPIAQDVAISVAKDTAKNALKSAISGSGRPRGRPKRIKSGEGFLDALKSVSKVVAPIAQDVAISVAKDTAKSALKSAISGSGRPRGRPRKMQGESAIGDWFKKAGSTITSGLEKTFSPVADTFEDLGNDIAGTAQNVVKKVERGGKKAISTVEKTANNAYKTISKEGQDVINFGKKIGDSFEDIADDVVGEFNRIKKTVVGKKINYAFAEVKKSFKKGGSAEQLGKGIASALIHQGIPFVLAEGCGALAVVAFPEGGPAVKLLGSKLGNALGVAIANKIGETTGYGFGGEGLYAGGAVIMPPMGLPKGMPRPRPINLPRSTSVVTKMQGSGMYISGDGLYAGSEGRGLQRFTANTKRPMNPHIGGNLLSPQQKSSYENFALSRTLPPEYQHLHK